MVACRKRLISHNIRGEMVFFFKKAWIFVSFFGIFGALRIAMSMLECTGEKHDHASCQWKKSPLEAAAMLPSMDHLSSPATCPPNAQVFRGFDDVLFELVVTQTPHNFWLNDLNWSHPRWCQLKDFYLFSPPILGEMIQVDLRIFFNWVETQPPTSVMS